MNNFGLIGKSIKHSISPFLHKEIAKIYNEKLEYKLYDQEALDLIKTPLSHLKNNEINGLNVTIPYKESVINLLDEITDKAKKIKAVNTIYLKDNKIFGDNTDYDGFLALLNINHIDLRNKRAIVLGTGGASKSVIQVLEDLNIEYKVVSRSLEKKSLNKNIITYEELIYSQYDVIINTTPVGMYPLINDSALSKPLVEGKTVIDLIYNPKETLLMKFAKESYNGIDMLIIQAIKAQEIWFNKEYVITREILEKLREKCYEYLWNAF